MSKRSPAGGWRRRGVIGSLALVVAAASGAAFAARTLGGSLIAFEIGNEPNVYKTESTYETSFNSYVSAIRAKVPDAQFDGPGAYGNTSWLNPFATHESSKLAICRCT